MAGRGPGLVVRAAVAIIGAIILVSDFVPAGTRGTVGGRGISPGSIAEAGSETSNSQSTHDGAGIAAPASLSGWFEVIWADGPPGSGVAPPPTYILVDGTGRGTQLLLEDELLTRAHSLHGRQVEVLGAWTEEAPAERAARQAREFRVREIQRRDREGAAHDAARTGSRPWLTILCRFGDSTSDTPRPVSWFESLMGSAYPGMDHYWREVSYDAIDLSGSTIAGWYDLPQARSYYVPGDNDVADTEKLVLDCTAAADADVQFGNFVGVNLMFNQSLGCCSIGGGWVLPWDGESRHYGVTWMHRSHYENYQSVLAHEMGHAFGLPHSSGPYGAIYDSDWDVMSGPSRCSVPHADHGCVAVHAIASYKDRLSFIPAGQKYVAQGGVERLALERLAMPQSQTNYLLAEIPTADEKLYYTLELRRFAGYDEEVLGEAVVIHKVDTTRFGGYAFVVDPDGDGDPNDEAAMWTVGETFTDEANGIRVTVDEAPSPSSVRVTIETPYQDAGVGHWAGDQIRALARSGITAGCGSGGFCPDRVVTRAEMAVFVTKVLGQAPSTLSGRFSDVAAGDFGAGYIERFADLRITSGCGTSRFCPDDPVTRGQMAVFMTLAKGWAPMSSPSPSFGDVPSSHPFYPYIERFFSQGVTAGCSAGTYCPERPVNRAEMAVFLVQAFDLP